MSIKVGAQTSTFSHADSLLAKGKYRLALANLKSIDTLQDISTYKVGNIYASIDDYKNAIVFYKKSLEHTQSSKVQLSLAKAFHKVKKYKDAINIYETFLETNADNLLITYQLGKLYFSVNNLKKATEIFKILSEEDVTNPNYHYQLGLIAARKGDGNAMLDNFLNAYEVDKTHIKTVYQLAKTFALIRKKDSSNLFIEKGLHLDSLHINLNKLKINELYRDEKYNEAISRLKMLDSLSPNDLYNKKMLGRSYFNIDSLNLAEANFKIAKIIDKEDFKILTYLGHIYKAKKDSRKAMVSYLRATKVGAKERSEEYFSLATIYLERKEYSIAIKLLKKAVDENIRKHKIKYQLAITSDSFYKDKKIAYNLYEGYLMLFEEKDKDITAFVKNRMKEIKKELFLKGEKVD